MSISTPAASSAIESSAAVFLTGDGSLAKCRDIAVDVIAP